MTWDMIFQIALMCVSILGIILNNYKKTSNFYVFIFAYICWAIIYFEHGLYPAAIKEIVFIGFNIHGIMLWSERDRRCGKGLH